MKNMILETQKVNKIFGHGKNKVHAVNNIDFKIRKGEIISIVGESGSGKTTFAKILIGLLKEDSGEISFMDQSRTLKRHKDRKAYWEEVQAIFQDPFASFNRFYKVKTLFDNC